MKMENKKKSINSTKKERKKIGKKYKLSHTHAHAYVANVHTHACAGVVRACNTMSWKFENV